MVTHPRARRRGLACRSPPASPPARQKGVTPDTRTRWMFISTRVLHPTPAPDGCSYLHGCYTRHPHPVVVHIFRGVTPDTRGGVSAVESGYMELSSVAEGL
eukprot:274843-Pyramimonas_sp.AAC.1